MSVTPTPWPQPSIIIWVSPDGDDITGTGTDQNPYKTIERALLDFKDGYQIRLMDGTYTPTDTVMISGMSGSIFAENADEVIIQPQQTTIHSAAIAILNSSRFTIHGITINQSETDGHNYGIYANNVENFVVYKCSINGFTCGSSCAGIWAIGTGRIEGCTIGDLSVTSGTLYGIYSNGLDIVDCDIVELTSTGTGTVIGICTVSIG